jgi:tetratricopeptide (TPR) repeat protein
MMEKTDAPLTAILTVGIPIPPNEAIYLERSIHPLLGGKNNQTIYEIKESSETYFGAVGRTEMLRDALRRGYSVLSAESLRSAGLDVRKPQYGDYPFQFDNLLCSTELMQLEGQWEQAAKIYDFLASEYGNEIWMRTRQANALYHAGQFAAAAGVAGRLNQKRPTTATYLIEARARKKLADYKTAIGLYRQAQAILDPKSAGPEDQAGGLKISKPTTQTVCRQPEETLVWT